MTREIRQIAIVFKILTQPPNRAKLTLAIVTKVEVELQIWSICQQILKKGQISTVKEPWGSGSNSIAYGKGGDQICIGGGGIKGGDKPSKGGDRQLEPCVPPLPPLKKKP